ncbi:MAG TPA: hypothetical protein VFB21_00410 [Chthonomonadaceae bacterium]|nr:hypothetical protein [Chthonomonadaceae bacterium]
MAGDECGCNAVLVPSLEIRIQNQQTIYAYIKVIDEASFNMLKMTNSAGFNILLNTLWLDASATWGKFQGSRSSYLESQDFRLDVSASEQLLRQTISSEAIEAWRRCKAACGDKAGIHCWVIDADEEVVIVAFSWIPDPDAVRPGKVQSSYVKGGKAPPPTPPGLAFPIGKIFKVNSREIVIYHREPLKTFELGLTVNGHTDNIKVEAVKPGSEIVGIWQGVWENINETTGGVAGKGGVEFQVLQPPDDKQQVEFVLKHFDISTGQAVSNDEKWVASYKNRELRWGDSSGTVVIKVAGNTMTGEAKRHPQDGGKTYGRVTAKKI